MKRAEIDRKFDETCPERSRRIVAFAEIEKFLDTPVKHYSTGMYVRLAFAVAAHRSGVLTASLEPEILLVDEVLAVGDVAREGRTVFRWEPLLGRLLSSALALPLSATRSAQTLTPGRDNRQLPTYPHQ